MPYRHYHDWSFHTHHRRPKCGNHYNSVRRRQRPWRIGFTLVVLALAVGVSAIAFIRYDAQSELVGAITVDSEVPPDGTNHDTVRIVALPSPTIPSSAATAETPVPTSSRPAVPTPRPTLTIREQEEVAKRRNTELKKISPTLRQPTLVYVPPPTPVVANARADTVTQAEDMLSELELKVHEGINAERTKKGVPSLRWDDGLAAVARSHSNDMTERNYFSHDTPEGLDPTDRLHRAGQSCRKRNHYGVAENITIEFFASNVSLMATEAVKGWMGSHGHRENLLDRSYDTTGIGASFGAWRGYNAVYLTQVFC